MEQKYAFFVQSSGSWAFVGFHPHLHCNQVKLLEESVEHTLGEGALVIIEMPEARITRDWDQDLAKLLQDNK
jgi:hypothetical protein